MAIHAYRCDACGEQQDIQEPYDTPNEHPCTTQYWFQGTEAEQALLHPFKGIFLKPPPKATISSLGARLIGICTGTMRRRPALFTGLFKFEGCTRVSTNSLTPRQRKMSPWLGGPERKEDREIRLEYQDEKKRQAREDAAQRLA